MWDECNVTPLPHGVSVVQSCQLLRIRRRIYSPEEYLIGSGGHSKRKRVLLKQDRTKHANKRLWGQIRAGASCWGLGWEAVGAWLKAHCGRKFCSLLRCPWARYQKIPKACIETYPASLLPKEIKQVRRRKVGNSLQFIHAFLLLECKLTVHLFLNERLPWNSRQAVGVFKYWAGILIGEV